MNRKMLPVFAVLLMSLMTSANDSFIDRNNENIRNEGNCECVHPFLCENGNIRDDGKGIIYARTPNRLARKKLEDYPHLGHDKCGNNSLMCCLSQKRVQSTKALHRNSRSSLAVGGTCRQRERTFIGPNGNIIAPVDNEARVGEFPWMVSISIGKKGKIGNPDSKYNCGGSLIHLQVVLTSALCIDGISPQRLSIRAGGRRLENSTERFPAQYRRVSSAIIHEEFDRDSLHNDYGLLILDNPFDSKPNIDVVCLPEQGDRFDHQNCLASGWGKDEPGGSYHNILKRIELPEVPRFKCQDALRQTLLGKHFVLRKSFICAGGKSKKDMCTGDGGSPLVCPIKNDSDRYVQVGIVSWGMSCGRDGVPGVYSNVAAARNWIEEQLRAHDRNIEHTPLNNSPPVIGYV